VTEILAVILLGWGLLVVWVAIRAMRSTRKAKELRQVATTVEEWLEDTWRWER
jgi:hypothetical protein